MTRLSEWAIPGRVWAILLSWGVAVLAIAALLSYWIWHNEQEQEAREARLQLEQDQAMCSMIKVFLDGPEPLPGPEGDRSRSVRQAMDYYRQVLHCSELESASPGPARNRDHR